MKADRADPCATGVGATTGPDNPYTAPVVDGGGGGENAVGPAVVHLPTKLCLQMEFLSRKYHPPFLKERTYTEIYGSKP